MKQIHFQAMMLDIVLFQNGFAVLSIEDKYCDFGGLLKTNKLFLLSEVMIYLLITNTC